MIKPQIVKLLDIEGIELEIYSPETCTETIDELYEFGKIMFAESQNRGSQLDSKLATILGWSAASLTFLLLNRAMHTADWNHPVVWLAATAAMVAVGISGLALRTRMWASPSERDWFKESLMGDPEKLRRYHVISLLLAHQENARTVSTKARYVRWAEGCLALSAAVIFLVLCFS